MELKFGLVFEGSCLVNRQMANALLDISSKRAAILHQMAAINTMELGSLKAEYRPSSSGQKTGPYFKHQVWNQGANLSQRVSSEDAPHLQQAIENRQKFEQLSADFITLTVEQTRKQHAPLDQKKRAMGRSPRLSSPKKRSSRS